MFTPFAKPRTVFGLIWPTLTWPSYYL